MRPVPVPRSTNKRERARPQRLGHGRLDLLLGDIERADAVPVGGMLAEVGLRGCLALALQGFGALGVAADDGIVGVDGFEQASRQPAAVRAVGDVEIDPASLAEALDQSGLGEKLQMPADARLALAQDLGQILDVELAGRQQQQDAQTRRLGRGLEGGHELGRIEREGHLQSFARNI